MDYTLLIFEIFLHFDKYFFELYFFLMINLFSKIRYMIFFYCIFQKIKIILEKTKRKIFFVNKEMNLNILKLYIYFFFFSN